ncbi:hypothetical protein JCM6294_3653 [Bacteroides pyogenes DSM 20611 = JCM 6294]|uniref:Uncharacterized protein n=1 Tax=Bacteroides pyogenes DSM 20611 = JCM 6294 TaxID=1121100 RepID=W4PM14_9BACE|nr:hypothetical protein JCM6294_3653 [Bacteroides pyogenes DSM 20611 = JCM 6294]
MGKVKFRPLKLHEFAFGDCQGLFYAPVRTVDAQCHLLHTLPEQVLDGALRKISES